MTPFFIIAGVTVTVLEIIAVAVLFCAFVYVVVLGYPIHLYYEKTKRK
jgi:hypothetical protein